MADVTRPGSDPIAESEEEKGFSPQSRDKENHPDIMISVDTYRANVAQTLDAGADIINDISGLAFDPNLIEVIAQNRVPYILMHIRGTRKICKTRLYKSHRRNDGIF